MSSSGIDLKTEIAEQREEVQAYKPGSVSKSADRVEFPENLYIGLFGRTGCGKTSLINSLKFAAHGKLRRSQWQQVAGQEKAGGHTMFRLLADITKNIFVIDNRGLDDPNTEKAIAELDAQLDGKRGYSEIVRWQEFGGGEDPNDEDVNFSELDLTAGDPIGCAVFVFSARHDIDSNTNGLAEVIDFLHSHQGRYPVAIITHVDVAEKAQVENLKTVLQITGISDIFEVANVTSEKKLLEEPYQHNLLSFLERCMKDGDDTLIFRHYQRKEQQRKKEIAKKREEKKREQDEKRKADERREMAERERIERENEIKREREELQRQRREQESREAEYRHRAMREHAESQNLKMAFAEIKHAMELQQAQERERREQERVRRMEDYMRRLQQEKQDEIRRIMENNKKDEGGCKLM